MRCGFKGKEAYGVGRMVRWLDVRRHGVHGRYHGYVPSKLVPYVAAKRYYRRLSSSPWDRLLCRKGLELLTPQAGHQEKGRKSV